ncbi:MAG: response regulator [Bdellovibrionales bacterium]
MNDNSSATAHSGQTKSDIPISLGLSAVVLFFLLSGAVSYWNIRTISEDTERVTRTHDIISALENILSIMKDAETGQRGFIVTGDEKYLGPYNEAVNHIDQSMSNVERLVSENPVQASRATLVRTYIKAKLGELEQSIQIRRREGFASARAFIMTDRGKKEMDLLRMQIAEIQEEEKNIRATQIAEMKSSYGLAITSGIISGLLGMLLSGIIAYLVRCSAAMRRRQEWLQAGEAGLSTAMLGERRLEQLGESVLKFLAEYFGAQAGALFSKNGKDFRRIATYGVPVQAAIPEQFENGQGLLGQAAKDGRTFQINDVPDGYLSIGSALGQGKPRHLVISPCLIDGVPNGVLELGFVNPVEDLTMQLLRRVSESIGIAIRSANYRANLQNLLEETQRQSEELQTQAEELRVSNEELEEQSRMLKQSQTHLEQQQAELEQTNAQLEEQAQLLEDQKDDLSRTKAAVQLKAQELERASRYKSDFLANMSHELRTPLNSSLILAKLLADNPTGSLTEEQVKFAKTIQSSGNDLLTLINDILDLSKIEAGYMEVNPEPMLIEGLVKDLERIFMPMAEPKGLDFTVRIAPECPATISTDRMRLEQILKNLLSNAIKFTETGRVELAVNRMADKRIAFAVTDSGIGISEDQQDSIFEAFRQADSTISRKYGGTGLGLSISRELTRLLGGTLELKSEINKGSTFIITIPETFNSKQVASQDALEPETILKSHLQKSLPVEKRERQAAAAAPRHSRILDDRQRLSKNGRLIMIIEDDEAFAGILCELAHELDFECIISHNAEEALIDAMQYLPSAIVLDVGLPDQSGLTVLDRLKRDARTRHIPVHVVSGKDYAQTALSLGAVGYMIKPVKREELVTALKSLEQRFSQSMRRILIVEDDAVQRDSLDKLLRSRDVETVGAGTAGECLERLKETTFDCMVLDLSLPDASGYSLLETLSREDTYSFPPVIVYTGRDLSADEEQKLRRYSKSIIIKGAKSPERLLDEVTLFLHQVVADLPPEQQRMLEKARNRDAVLEGRHILVVEDDVRNVYALTNVLEPRGANVHIARNGREALDILAARMGNAGQAIDLVLMDVMMPEMDGLTATREIRKRPECKKLPVIMLTAKAMRSDQERCLEAGANDYMAKPLDIEKLLSLVRVWLPR